MSTRSKKSSRFLYGGTREKSWATQNNQMMQQLLLVSLTEDANACLLPCCVEYTSDAISESIILTPVLFKTIMRLAVIDNKATTEHLHENFQSHCRLIGKMQLRLRNSTCTLMKTTHNSSAVRRQWRTHSTNSSRSTWLLKMPPLSSTWETKKMNTMMKKKSNHDKLMTLVINK